MRINVVRCARRFDETGRLFQTATQTAADSPSIPSFDEATKDRSAFNWFVRCD